MLKMWLIITNKLHKGNQLVQIPKWSSLFHTWPILIVWLLYKVECLNLIPQQDCIYDKLLKSWSFNKNGMQGVK